MDIEGVTHNLPRSPTMASNSAPQLRRLLPSPAASISVRDAYDVPRSPHADRPWVGLCMVMSLDGSVVVDGTFARSREAAASRSVRLLISTYYSDEGAHAWMLPCVNRRR